jgi:hypothetical protein
METVCDKVGNKDFVLPDGDLDDDAEGLTDTSSDVDIEMETVGSGVADGVRVGGSGNVKVILADSLPVDSQEMVALTEILSTDFEGAFVTLGVSELDSTLERLMVRLELTENVGDCDGVSLWDLLAVTSSVGDVEADGDMDTL